MTLSDPSAAPRQQDRLYHDLLTPPDAQQVREEARLFADAHVALIAHQLAQAEETLQAFPWTVFKQLAHTGLFGVPFQAEDGGRGLRHRVTATVSAIEELAYRSNSIAAIYDVHCILAGTALAAGDAALRTRYLRPVIAGDVVGAFATTEPDASSDLSPSAVKTTADRIGDHYVVRGRKRFITNAPVADFIVTLCRTGDSLTLLVIDTNEDGIHVGPPDRKMGNRSQLTADVHLDGVSVPVGNRIGEEGSGLSVALATLTYGRVGIAAAGVGLAQAAFDQAVDHLLRRHAFGRPLAAFQHWQFLLAERATQIENARNLYLKAARRLDDGVRSPEPEAAMAKAYATEVSVTMARDAVQAFGGYGFLRELATDSSTYPVEAIYRDAKIGEIYEGTNEIQKWITARAIFGKEVTG